MPDVNKAHSFLTKWITDYVKNRDLIEKKIEGIEHKDNLIHIKYKDRSQYILIMPFLQDLSFLEKFEKQNYYMIVVFNTKENLDRLVESWKQLIGFRFLCIFFVNPWSSMDKRWMIYPYTHHQIADEGSLKIGLKSMFDMVEPVTESMLDAHLKN